MESAIAETLGVSSISCERCRFDAVLMAMRCLGPAAALRVLETLSVFLA